MPLLLFLLTLIILPACAQHSEQPKKEDNSDLRSQSMLFSVEDVAKKKLLWLERTANLDYFLYSRVKDDEEMIKLASKEGAKIDREFSARFLKCQYELPTIEGTCEVTHKLNMKGETLEICKKDDKKTQEMASFVAELSKRF